MSTDMLSVIEEFDLGGLLADELLVGSAVAGLDALVAQAYPDGGWPEYREWIAYHGNPADQIERFENAGIILQPKQLEFCAWARRMDTNEHIDGEQGAPELGIGGARGGGKSLVVFAQAAIDDCRRFPGIKVLYLRKVGKKAREQMLDLQKAVLTHVKHTATDGLIRFPNGSKIIMGHFNHEKEIFNYLGMGYDIIIVEEFTTLSKRVRQALRDSNRTSVRGMMPRMYNSTNPLGVGHQWYKQHFIIHERKYGDILNRRRKFIQATVDDNRFINVDYVGNLEENTGAELRAYRYGDWDVSAGAYFVVWDYELHTREPMKVPRNWPMWASMDYGLKHWNMIYFHTKFDGIIYTFHELAHREHYVAEIVPDIQTALSLYDRKMDDLEIFLVGSDVFARRGEAKKTVAQQYAELMPGIKMTAAVTGPGSRVAGAHHIAKLLGNPKRDIPPSVLITRNCARLIDCLPSLERNPNNPEDVRQVDMSDDGQGGDDPYDAWRYGIYRQTTISYKTTTKKTGF
jgi:hypothetical protein